MENPLVSQTVGFLSRWFPRLFRFYYCASASYGQSWLSCAVADNLRGRQSM